MKDKTVEFHFLLTEADSKKLSELSSKTSLSRSKVLRYLIRECHLIEAPPADYHKLIREIRAVGNNLNQTLVIAKTNGILNVPDLRQEILDLRKVEKELQEAFQMKEHGSG